MEEEKIRIRYVNPETNDILQAESRNVRIARTGIFLCLRGHGTVTLNGENIVIEPKSLMVYFPYSTLHIINKSDDLEGVIISCNLETIQPLLYKVSDFNGLFLIRQNPYTGLTDIQVRHLTQYISLVHDAYTKECIAIQESTDELTKRPVCEIYQQQLELLTNCLMLEIVSCYTKFVHTNSSGSRKDSVLQKFITQLYQNFRTEHEVRYYSDQQFLTSRYFSAIIKEKSGKAPSEWIAVALLGEAKRLLSTTNKSIKEVSDELHFPNQSYFGKWFKNLTGGSPIEYKHGKGVHSEQTNDFDDFMKLLARR